MKSEIIIQTFRIKKDTRDLLERIAENRSETVSNFIRRAILKELASLSFLTPEVKKSLGFTIEDSPLEEA